MTGEGALSRQALASTLAGTSGPGYARSNSAEWWPMPELSLLLPMLVALVVIGAFGGILTLIAPNMLRKVPGW